VSVDVLGPLRLTVRGAEVEVPGPKRRAVLALLALAEGRVVTLDRLLDALWPADPPETGRAALHSHVSRLRGHLGPAATRLETLDGGYRLRLGVDECDLAAAKALRRRAASAPPAEAFDLLREADGLWRGPVLPDLRTVEPVDAAVTELADLRRAVVDELIRAGLDTGRLDGLVERATAVVTADPLREPAVALLVRALATAGRPADALGAAREFRARLAEETGLDPSPALAELERAVAGGRIGPPAPPARAAAALPVGPLIGREAQLADLRARLETDRLVTVAGPGGVGKTRLALEVAAAGPAPTVLLAAVTDPDAVPHALAAALDLQTVHGDVLAACVALLAPTPKLVLLDNCEHLLDAVRDAVATLLAGCPRLTVLTTSREPLGLAAESLLRLPPLQLPLGEAGALDRVPAVAVFLDRAARVRPGFIADPAALHDIVEIVRRLDGMPLAIELAAGRLSAFSTADLRARLDRALDLLASGRPSADARHRTLRATVDWSYTLLDPAEQRLFRNLAVFVDGADLATVEQVAAELDPEADPAAALAHLIDASMLEVEFGDGGARYRMLETLRAFGLDRLAAEGEAAAADDRLLRWALRLVRWIDETIATDEEPLADAVLRREIGTLRVAWRLARDHADLDAAAEIVSRLQEPASWRDRTELRGWARELAADPAVLDHPRADVVLATAAIMAYHDGDRDRTERLGRQALAGEPEPLAAWMARTALSLAALSRTDFAQVIEHALAAAAGYPRRFVNYGMAALAATYSGELERAADLQRRSAASATSPTGHAFAAYAAGEIENAAGRHDAAERHYAVALDLARTAGATFVTGIASVGLLSARAAAGHTAAALEGYRDVVEYWARTGNWTHLWVTLRNLADLLRTLGDGASAEVLDAAADAAPDAPPRPGRAAGTGSGPDRVTALDTARAAIDRHLTGA
jgi:predicted ATPase/DNA-binding SARP family transcriptional activator